MTRSTLALPQRRILREVRPHTPNQLHQWLRAVLDIEVPRAPILPASTAPFDYLTHTFFEGAPPSPLGGEARVRGQTQQRAQRASATPPSGPLPSGSLATPSPDAVVWAPRGGGKTFYAALATLLDLLFKPTIEIKIIAGSLEQGQRMHEHLRKLLEHPHMRDLTQSDDPLSPSRRARLTDRRIILRNNSRCDILAQSHTSVRGARPQKLRCDEAELFDPDIWQAAQLVTRSAQCGSTYVRGAVEALSTMHEPHGLMSDLITDPNRRLFRWSLVDTLERCAPERPCDPCPLLPECAQRAKRAAGHIPIDDAITLKSRVDEQTWNAEMLCLRPTRSDAVLPEFDHDTHITPFDPPQDPTHWHWLAGMDFGFRAPTVILWAALDTSGVLRIIDERTEAGVVTQDHARAITQSNWPTPQWIGVDPAGAQRSEQTGHSAITVLRQHALTIRWRRSTINEGLRAIRTRLRPATGPPTLFIHPRCTNLIESIDSYRYPKNKPEATTPIKDGQHDHAIDALRYLIINLDNPYTTTHRRYA